MIEAGKIYKLKEEFFEETGITIYQFRNRKEELLEWLKEFYDYEIYEGRPIRIYIKAVLGPYQDLPRKINSRELSEKKIEDYKNFTIAALGTEFKPNSKAKTSREAIAAFGQEKYGHNNVEGVSRRYVGPMFDTYGESNNVRRWVWYSTYEPLDTETLERWRLIMEEEHISEREAANAFYRHAEGEDISKEKEYFKRARDRFVAEFGDFTILVADWRLRKSAD